MLWATQLRSLVACPAPSATVLWSFTAVVCVWSRRIYTNYGSTHLPNYGCKAVASSFPNYKAAQHSCVGADHLPSYGCRSSQHSCVGADHYQTTAVKLTTQLRRSRPSTKLLLYFNFQYSCCSWMQTGLLPNLRVFYTFLFLCAMEHTHYTKHYPFLVKLSFLCFNFQTTFKLLLNAANRFVILHFLFYLWALQLNTVHMSQTHLHKLHCKAPISCLEIFPLLVKLYNGVVWSTSLCWWPNVLDVKLSIKKKAARFVGLTFKSILLFYF